MPAENDTRLEKFQDWTLRTRPAAQTPSRLLLLVHGLSGDENSMWVFTNNLPKTYWIMAPRAIHAAPQGRFSWRTLPASTGGGPGLDAFRPAAEALIRLVDAYPLEAGLETSTFDAIGFSQGGALVNVLSCLFPQRVRKAGILSGFMPSGMDELVARKPLTGKPVFVAHGTLDNVVPPDRAQASVELLKAAGAELTYCESAVRHKLSIECLRALETFLRD